LSSTLSREWSTKTMTILEPNLSSGKVRISKSKFKASSKSKELREVSLLTIRNQMRTYRDSVTIKISRTLSLMKTQTSTSLLANWSNQPLRKRTTKCSLTMIHSLTSLLLTRPKRSTKLRKLQTILIHRT